MSYDKAVADELRGLKKIISDRPSHDGPPDDPIKEGHIDRSVREAVNEHLDEAIAKREKIRPTSGVF